VIRLVVFFIFVVFSYSSYALSIKGASLKWISSSISNFKYDSVTVLGNKIYKFKDGKFDVEIRKSPYFDYVIKIVDGELCLDVVTDQAIVSGFMMETIAMDFQHYL
jgi:hypothetical protein